jgi:signal transduction histidine kinase
MDISASPDPLENLRNWVAEFYEVRSSAPSLLTQLNIGVDIIDQQYKVWFINEAMRRIIGYRDTGLPKAPCASWHGYRCYPCPGCIVKKSFDDSNAREQIFLSPLKDRTDREIIFLKVWTQPVVSQEGKLFIDSDGKPLVVMESVYELTNTEELRSMPLNDRISLIASSLKVRFIEQKNCVRPYFDFVRIYILEQQAGNGHFILKASEGDPKSPNLDIPVDLYGVDGEHLRIAEDHMRKEGYGYWFPASDSPDPIQPFIFRQPFIYWPLIENQKTIAVIEAGGLDTLSRFAEIIKPYAVEMLSALEDDRKRSPKHAVVAEASKKIVEISNKLQTTVRPTNSELAKEQLKVIIENVCQATDSHLYVLRYKDENDIRLLPLRIVNYSDYEKLAQPDYPTTYSESWSCLTINAGVETLANTAENSDIIMKYRENLTAQAQKVMEDVQSLCFEPLLLEGICIGSLGFHSKNVRNYKDDGKLLIIRTLARRATMALHDYIIAEKIREKADLMADILGLVLHNINTPLMTGQITLERLQNRINRKTESISDIQDLLDVLQKQFDTISRVRVEVLRFEQPWEPHIECVNLANFLNEEINPITSGVPNLKVDYLLSPKYQSLNIDVEALRLCLRVIVQNAIDELSDLQVEKQLKIVLRETTEEEKRQVEASNVTLAVDIIDNGPGVSREMVDKLFTKMVSTKPRGLGMGLMQCRVIARSANGTVYYDRNYNSGAKFTVVMPYNQSEGVRSHENPGD